MPNTQSGFHACTPPITETAHTPRTLSRVYIAHHTHTFIVNEPATRAHPQYCAVPFANTTQTQTANRTRHANR